MLIFDSDLFYAKSLATMFSAFDCEVHVATSTSSAIDLVLREEIEAIVMEESAARRYGDSFHKQVRAISDHAFIAVMSSREVPFSEQHPYSDTYLRPGHFFSDLCKYYSARRGAQGAIEPGAQGCTPPIGSESAAVSPGVLRDGHSQKGAS